MHNWPLPPFFQEANARTEPDALDAVIFSRDAASLVGQLAQFSPLGQKVAFKARGETELRALPFSQIKSIQLINPIQLVADAELIRLYQLSGGEQVEPADRPFGVTFTDGEQLRGQTKGFVKTQHGLFVFLTTHGAQAIRIFVPETALMNYQVGSLLGQQLVGDHALTPEQITQALAEQSRRRQTQVDQHLGDAPTTADQLNAYAPVRLGDILMNQGLVSREQLAAALGRVGRDKHSLLGNILVETGALTRAKLTQAVAQQLNIPLVTLREFVIDPAVVSMVPKAYAFEHHVMALLATEKTLVVALESPLNADYLDALRLVSHRQIVPVIANPEELATRIAAEYSSAAVMNGPTSIADEIALLNQQPVILEASLQHAYGNRQVSDTDTLLVRLVNKMIEDAHREGASDIHVEAYPDDQPTRIRFRIDGVLSEYLKLPHTLRAAMISRLKIMSNLDISEHRKPQDGKIDFARFAPLKLELRVASLPTANGLEDIVMRLLASSKPTLMGELGFSSDLAVQLKKMVRRSYGLILVCGPTGSGKTTTLHSLLAEVNTEENKIWTAEDPIEITTPVCVRFR